MTLVALDLSVARRFLLALCGAALLQACQDEPTPKPSDAKKPPVAAAASSAPSKGKAAPAPAKPDIAAFCPDLCKRTRQLNCARAPGCDDFCAAGFKDIPCPELLHPAMECALSQPLSTWICSPDGFGAVADGPCDREQAAYSACLTELDVEVPKRAPGR